MSNISYRGKNYNAALLVAIAGQGVAIEIDAKQLKCIDDHAVMGVKKNGITYVVTKNGDAYDLLAVGHGQDVQFSGVPTSGKVSVMLVSKHVLAKAESQAAFDRFQTAVLNPAVVDQNDRRPPRFGSQGTGSSYHERRSYRY